MSIRRFIEIDVAVAVVSLSAEYQLRLGSTAYADSLRVSSCLIAWHGPFSHRELRNVSWSGSSIHRLGSTFFL